MIVGLTGKQWRSLCKACGLQAQMDALGERLGLDLSREGNRFRARQAIGSLIEVWVGAHTAADVAAAFDAHGVCWSRYQTIESLVANDEACSTENPLFSYVDQPGAGRTLTPGLPLDYSALGRSGAQTAPRLGQHTEEVLHDLLGMSTAEFGKLAEQGIVRTG